MIPPAIGFLGSPKINGFSGSVGFSAFTSILPNFVFGSLDGIGVPVVRQLVANIEKAAASIAATALRQPVAL